MVIIIETLIMIGISSMPCVFIKLADSIEKRLKKRKIKKMQKTIYKNIYLTNSKTEKNEICVICQEDYDEENKCSQLHCNHKYHAKCISKWIKEKPTCPLCNEYLKLKNGKYIHKTGDIDYHYHFNIPLEDIELEELL